MKPLKTLAFIEDEPDIRTIARLSLESVGGFHVDLYSSGPEAIEKLPENPVDLILLDVMMPEMDGPATLRALRDIPTCKDIPVVFMTAKAMHKEVQSYRDLGVVDVIAKPFDPMELAGRVRAAWSRSHLSETGPDDE